MPLTSLSSTGSFLSFIIISVSRTSLILSAATPALGSIMDIIESIRKDMMMSIVYVINAVMAPTCNVPSSILWAATHSISMLTQNIRSIRSGIMKVMTLFTKSMVFVRSLFASSNLSSSFFSLPKALITGIPVSISLDTRFTRSTSFCMTLNLGIAMTIRVPIRTIIAMTDTTIIHPICAPVFITFIIPPTARIGE